MTVPTCFGPEVGADGVMFRLWAPSARDVQVEVQGMAPVLMQGGPDGWKQALVPCAIGARYRFRIEDMPVPDPASRLQDGGVHGWSVVCAPGRDNADEIWRGRAWNETVLYELHPGVMGGFAGIETRLENLAGLGITAVELMPVAAFPGARNWGYDGVLPFAPAEAYGTPDDLRRLIAHAHRLGLMVFLDVVYNHFGPDGNFLPLYAKPFFRDDKQTPWGAAIDFRQDAVRAFFSENAHYWIHEFGFDGLRFDAVHAISDNGWLVDLAATIRQSVPERHVHLILENEDNTASFLHKGFDAQWNDDIHHVLHVLLTDENRGYYRDFSEYPAQKLAKALSDGFIYHGQKSLTGHGRGTPSADLPSTAFVAFLQNHDQIGNRAFGERLTTLANEDALKAAIALLLLCPQIPLLFMGEECGSRSPFLYFTDHGDDLAEAVRKGRRKEFAAFLDSADIAALPDPNAPESFRKSDPAGDAPSFDVWQDYYRSLLNIRNTHIAPYIGGASSCGASAVGTKAVLASWRLDNGVLLTIACNLGSASCSAGLPQSQPVWGAEGSDEISAYTTLVWLEQS